MRNWKKLGEVPDSDDESLKSFEPEESQPEDLPQLPPTDAILPHEPARNAATADIWDIPSSPKAKEDCSLINAGEETDDEPLSSPPDSPALTQDDDGFGETALVHGPEDEAEEKKPSKTVSQPVEPIAIVFDDDVSRLHALSAAPLSTASPTPSPLSSLSSLPSSSLFLSRHPSPVQEPRQHEQASPADRPQSEREQEEESRQVAVRLERSFRPRKPIQQHPYRLEGAHYASLMKSRGVKPVKIPRNPELERRRQEEDSQDRDFEAGESQEASDERLNETNEESGQMILGDSLYDVDELALSPSPKMSSARRQLQSSSQRSTRDTDATSIEGEDDDDDELPSVEDLLLNPNMAARVAKRQKHRRLLSRKRQKPSPHRPPSSSPARRFIRPHRLSSPHTEALDAPGLSSDLGTTPVPPMRNRVEVHLLSRPSRSVTPSPARTGLEATVDLTTLPDDLSDATSSEGEPSNDSELVTRHVRKIRGVLPASWLRLDQQKGRDTIQKQRDRRTPEHSPERVAPRRGVAMLRQSTPKPSTAPVFSLDDFSDEGDDATPAGLPEILNPGRDLPSTKTPFSVFDDTDPGLAMEDNQVDRMVIGDKRSGSSSKASGNAKRRKTQQKLFKGRSEQKTRQPRINQVLGRSKSMSSANREEVLGPNLLRKRTSGSDSHRTPRPRAVRPPMLSILDVMEPQAPAFVKIAARTAKRRRNLGKASPSKKIISLATRADNVDALSALRDWKSGRTRPKVSLSPVEPTRLQETRPALGELSTNTAVQSSALPSTGSSRLPMPRKFVRQAGIDGFVTISNGLASQPSRPLQHSKPPKPLQKVLRYQSPQMRPAQLETDDVEGVERDVFKARKRALDSLYRKARKGQVMRASSVVSLEKYFDSISSASQGPGERETTGNRKQAPGNPKTRFRKRFVPKCVDVGAPQYTHANDPLPAFGISSIEEDAAVIDEHTSKEKLKGLAPYGTPYTQHFEIFPLDQGTYFHASTLIGRGCISKAVDPGFPARLRRSRPRTYFVLDERTLQWGPWDDSMSSELGILMDWVTDKLVPESFLSTISQHGPVDAADYILNFILDSLSFQGDDEEKAFILRSLELIQNFVGRSEPPSHLSTPEVKTAHAQVYARFTVVIVAIYQLAMANGSEFSLTCQLEDLLVKMVKLCVNTLLDIGLGDLRTMYGNLQHVTARERGIRPSQVAASCWVVVMRVLENIHIPRSSFWDVTHSVMLQRDVISSADAQQFESLWLSMFTLLPLSEFDNSGILVSGLRHTLPMEGWTLPQQLAKRVFDLYKANPRQPPSFNEYCRAIIARCHYLVQQWGWSKCSGIIGTIFDFFGSQNLGHLRNEEVYKSPSFLENLCSNPSLAVEPEDRCFHIFIKTLAVAIQRLKKQDRTKDIRNLVTRTLPNHNRQYKKEDTIHQHDLAALRNHHDLLCTLFWAAPPDLRPAIHLIEKLVSPESSHKEAVMINIRAWSQLASFLVSSSEGSTAFKPFVSWQNNVFQHVLDQYLSAASDIEQQFRALSGQSRDISTAMKDQMILRNKGAAMDVLYVLMKASFEVLKHANSLGSAAYTLNIYQLQRVFSNLDYSSPTFDWTVIRVALDTVEHYMDRLKEAKAAEEQYSSEDMGTIDSQELEDAVQLVDVHIVKEFFFMGRQILALPPVSSPRRASEQATCVEKTVTLGASIATRFFKDRITLLAPYFNSPKYGLFTKLPKYLDSRERKYLPLFVATLIKNHIYSFSDLGSTLLELWMLSITKPSRSLQYENYLAGFLKQNGLPFIQRATVPATAPDYNANRDYFACIIHYMRKALRVAGSTQGRPLREEFKGILQLIMKKIKQDLHDLTSNPSEHKAYIGFVRQIISLIKSHGVGICVVDPFFTQPSPEYSPPVQDPQLHVDGIVGYGVKIGEKDSTAVPQLFHYLYNNFKIALANDKLKDECGILEKALFNPEIVSFMLQFMLPAIVDAAARASEAWLLLQVYVSALVNTLTRSCVPMELRGQDIEDSAALLQAIVAWFLKLREGNRNTASLQQVYIIGELLKLANAQQSSVQTWLCLPPRTGDEFEDGLYSSKEAAKETVASLRSFTQEGSSYLKSTLSLGEHDIARDGIQTAPLLGGLSHIGVTDLHQNPRVTDFANHIVADVKRSWVVTSSLVTIRMAGKPASSAATGTPAVTGSQSRNGTTYGPWALEELLQRVYEEMGRWRLEMPPLGEQGRSRGRGRGRRERTWDRASDEEELIF